MEHKIIRCDEEEGGKDRQKGMQGRWGRREGLDRGVIHTSSISLARWLLYGFLPGSALLCRWREMWPMVGLMPSSATCW